MDKEKPLSSRLDEFNELMKSDAHNVSLNMDTRTCDRVDHYEAFARATSTFIAQVLERTAC